MKAKPIGLYVHIPFCVRKCAYCDFCSFDSFSKTDTDRYVKALCEEIASYKREPRIEIDTVFFGGGTPSLLSTSQLKMITDRVKDSFDISALSEFTVEVNPKTLTEEKLSGYLALGVNRFSIGLQSVHQNELKKLGRIHSFDDFLTTYELIRSAGVKNISVDLMYGLPNQTKESFIGSLEKIISLCPEHISVYSLILEENTPLFNEAKSLSIPDDDEVSDMYLAACSLLGSAGYTHYEISNFAKQGFECRHNLKYWRDEEYIGVGISAYSYFEGARFGNSGDRHDAASLSRYIDKEGGYQSFERTDLTAEAYEYAMLRLRLKEGLCLSEYESRFGHAFSVGKEDLISRLCDAGLVMLTEGRLALTEKGFFVSNAILSELL